VSTVARPYMVAIYRLGVAASFSRFATIKEAAADYAHKLPQADGKRVKVEIYHAFRSGHDDTGWNPGLAAEEWDIVADAVERAAPRHTQLEGA
jgi:hypothetical protein